MDCKAATPRPASDLPTASILRISDDKTMQLLDLYREEECLWNTNNEYYKDQMHRRRAAEKIASLLDIPNFTSRHVIMKFKNLRNAYSQELKKIVRNEEVGIIYKPSVFWFKKMDAFIKPHLQKARGAGAGAGARSNVVCKVDGTEDWIQANAQIPPYVLTTEIEEVTSENDSCDSQKKRKLQNTYTWSKRQRIDSDSDEPKFIEITIPQPNEAETNTNFHVDQSVKDYVNDQQKTMLKTFQELSTSIRSLSSRSDDVFDSFGKYVAGLLRTLPRNKALEVQPQIVNLITAAGLQNIVLERQGETVFVKEEI